jgi:hypothetical protein
MTKFKVLKVLCFLRATYLACPTLLFVVHNTTLPEFQTICHRVMGWIINWEVCERTRWYPCATCRTVTCYIVQDTEELWTVLLQTAQSKKEEYHQCLYWRYVLFVYFQHDPLQKRTEKYSLFTVSFAVGEKNVWFLCHYFCGVVKCLERSHGIDDIFVLFKYKFNLHTTVRYKVSLPMINPAYRSTIYTYAEWRRLTGRSMLENG